MFVRNMFQELKMFVDNYEKSLNRADKKKMKK